MTFRSLATLKGTTPVDVGDTPGQPAGTRFVGFGEQVTSAITNRPNGALGENTDNLNSRIVPFETSGLNSAYRLGLAAVPGGGRLITKDGGAVETVSALGVMYADDHANAGFRANMLGDTIGGGVGFISKMRRVGAGGTSGNDGYAGDLHLAAMTFTTGNTVINSGESVTLNPGGASPTTIRLNTGGRKFHTSTASLLAFTLDLIEVEGGTKPGVYLVYGAGGANTDVIVRDFNGNSPSFANNEVTTATVYRIRLGSLGGYGTARTVGGTFVGGAKTALSNAAALNILSGASGVINAETDLVTRAINFFYNTDGGVVFGNNFDLFGRFNALAHNSSVRTADRQFRGDYATRVDKSNSIVAGEVSHIVEDGSNATAFRYDYMSLSLMNPSEVAGLDASVPVDLSGATMSPNPALPTDWVKYCPPYGVLVELLTSTVTDTVGLYYVSTSTGTASITVKNLDGTTPAFGAGQSGTMRVLTMGKIGRSPALTPGVELGTPSTTFTPYAMLTAGKEQDAAALALISPLSAAGTRSYLRCMTYDSGATPKLHEKFKIEETGDAYSDSTMSAKLGFIISGVTSEFVYGAGRSKVVQIPMSDGVATASWTYSLTGYDWSSSASDPQGLAIPFIIPTGCILTTVRVLINPFVVSISGPQFFVSRIRSNFTTPAAPSATILASSSTYTAGAGAWQVMTTGVFSETVDRSIRSYAVHFQSSTAASGSNHDLVGGVEITFTDPGPRNF